VDSNGKAPKHFPSVHELKPSEEGGPIARSGFNYQDEVAVSLVLDMLESASIVCVQCETQDDAVVVYASQDGEIAEHVQVKSDDSLSQWSVAALTRRVQGKIGTSIFETSLSRDRLKETSRFRIVTQRAVAKQLKCLTFPLGMPGRSGDHGDIKILVEDLASRCGGAVSRKNNGPAYWVANCLWDVRESHAALTRHNLLRILKLSLTSGYPLLPEQGDVVLRELRQLVKAAGDAKWEPDRDKKVLKRVDLAKWWCQRIAEIADGASTVSGGKLRQKMSEVGLSQSTIQLAVDMRRMYSAEARSTSYMEPEESEALQWSLKSAIASLQSARDAGEFELLSGVQFHDLCVKRVDALTPNNGVADGRRAAFLKGCLYDIADRCLLRFSSGTS
jgi:hypothetical protein